MQFYLVLYFKNRSGRPADDELGGFSGLTDDILAYPWQLLQ